MPQAGSIYDAIHNSSPDGPTALPIIAGASPLTVYQQIHNTQFSPTALNVTFGSSPQAVTAPINITVQSATAFTVARAGTNYAFQVDTNTASSVTGLKITSAAAASGLALAVISSGTNENLTIDAKGSGTITYGGTSTGANIFGLRQLAIGTSSLTTGRFVEISGNSPSTATTEVGLTLLPNSSATATTAGIGFRVAVTVVTAGITQATQTGIYIDAPTKNNNTITTYRGLFVEEATNHAATNYTAYLAMPRGTGVNYGLRIEQGNGGNINNSLYGAYISTGGWTLSNDITSFIQIYVPSNQVAASSTTKTVTNLASVYIAGAPTLSGTAAATNGPYALWVDADTTRLDGNLTFSAAAADIIMAAATTNALKITNGTTAWVGFDTRLTTVGVYALTVYGAAMTIASGAGNIAGQINCTSFTLNYTGTTQVTSLVSGRYFSAIALAGDTATLTVDKAASMTVLASSAGTNITLTHGAALRILNAIGTGTTTHLSGIYVEAITGGGTNNYQILLENGGTEPAGLANYVGIYALDLSAGNASIGFATEHAVAVSVATASTHKWGVRINGATYYILVSNV